MSLGTIIEMYGHKVDPRKSFNTEKEVRSAFCSNRTGDALTFKSAVFASGITLPGSEHITTTRGERL